MDETVDKAIKQLEAIAIKAMDSGYLDDAAKVMHIAEQIERVDKNSTADDDVVASAERSGNVVELGDFRQKRDKASGDDSNHSKPN